jgi:transcriptional regulator with XRE-family HTH domain
MEKNQKKKPRRSRSESSVFAKNLGRILKDRNISTRVAANMANVPQSTLQDWLQGSAPSDLEKVNNLAKALGVSFTYLCLGHHESPSLESAPLEAIFDEVESGIEGIFKISAVRLIRKSKKGSSI